jgi:tRNA modification GTPase
MFDTIASISTPRGEGGIGIVRMSGDQALLILSKIFKPISKKNVEELKNFTINYGNLYDESGDLVDEVLVSIMKGPNTYTTEDIVEITVMVGIL